MNCAFELSVSIDRTTQNAHVIWDQACAVVEVQTSDPTAAAAQICIDEISLSPPNARANITKMPLRFDRRECAI